MTLTNNKIVDRLIRWQVIKSVFLLLIPLFLRIKVGYYPGSISAFYSTIGRDEFIILLTLASTLYITDGVTKNKWYNIVVGIALVLVAYFPYQDKTDTFINEKILHYLFATIFFAGSVVAMIVYSSKEQRLIKIIAGSLIIVSMVLHFAFDVFTLLVAEWIAMIPISIHFAGEALNKID